MVVKVSNASIALQRVRRLLSNQSTGGLSGDLALTAIAASAFLNSTVREQGEGAILELLPLLLIAYPKDPLTQADVATAAAALGMLTRDTQLQEGYQYSALNILERYAGHLMPLVCNLLMPSII